MQSKSLISFEKTGDPFIDAGGFALEKLIEIFPEKSILDLIKWASEIYVKKWNSKINSIFLNNPITQSNIKNEEKINKAVSMFENIINNKSNLGWCRFCGKETHLTPLGRDKACIVGSGAFVNFHHSHDNGLLSCSDCAIKYFFLPFMVIQLGGNLALLQSITHETDIFWRKITLEKHLNDISKDNTDGLLKSDFSKPINAFFNIVFNLILEFPEKQLKESLTLYYFTNFAAKTDCEIYIINNPVFNFVSKSIKNCPKQWYNFLNYYYQIKGAKWDIEIQNWKIKDEVIDNNKFLNNNNNIFNALIDNKNISMNMCKYYKNQIGNTKLPFDIRIAYYYLEEVRKMKKEQFNLIQKIGDKIFEIMSNENDFKKYIFLLEKVKRPHELRASLISIIKKHYNNNNPEPLITLNEWVNYLFPDGQYWGEVRDLLLIYLYEKMHINNLSIEIDSELEITENENNLNEEF